MIRTCLLLLLTLSPYFNQLLKAQFQAEASNSITVFREGGSQLDNPWCGGVNSVQLSMVDADFDGFEDDIYIFDRQGNRSLVFTGNTDGLSVNYNYAPQFRHSFPTMTNYTLLRDFDCDGNRDIFTYSPLGGAVSIYRNSGSSTALTWELVTEAVLSFFDFGSTEFDTNIFTSSQDIPAIFDYDGDGDLDILSFNVGGTFIELHLNSSMEETGLCGLEFFLANRCYGGFIEGDSDNGININPDDVAAACIFNVDNPKDRDQNLRHVGSTILTLDGNNDGLQDIILGDVGFDNMVYLENSNPDEAPDQVVSFDTEFPLNMGNSAVSINNFPAGYYEDVSGDGIPDLIVGVNATAGAVSINSVHLYLNQGTESSPNFEFATNSFLQSTMLDWGRNTSPTVTDFNNDGLLDIVIGFSRENQNELGTIPRLVRMLNIGNEENPSFQIIDEDWLVISNELNSFDPSPAFGDFDQDGDNDLVVGLADGSIHLYENNGTYVYSGTVDLSGMENTIEFSANLEVADLNDDGFPDLLIGEGNGNINYFENNGNSGTIGFSLITENLGEISTVQSPPFFEGRSAPCFFQFENQDYLATGSKSGKVFVHQINGLNSAWDELNNGIDVYNDFDTSPLGLNTDIVVADLNNDGFPEIISGLSTGGLELFIGSELLNTTEASLSGSKETTTIYPNPSSGLLNIDFTGDRNDFVQLNIFSSEGKLVFDTNQMAEVYDLKFLESGLYLIHLITKTGIMRSKWIKK